MTEYRVPHPPDCDCPTCRADFEEQKARAMTEDRVPTTEPLNTILQAIVQHATDSGMSFDDLRVLNRLIEKVEQASAQPALPLDVDGIVAELVGVEAALEDVRRRLVRATDTLGSVARLSTPSRSEPE